MVCLTFQGVCTLAGPLDPVDPHLSYGEKGIAA